MSVPVRRAALAVAVLAYALAVLAFRPHPTPGPALRDFEAYYAAGAAWDRGEDPYGTAIWSYERSVPGVDPRREALLPFVNPPPMLPLLGALARLPFGSAAFVWGALLVLALGALLAVASRVAAVEDRIAIVALVPLALAFGPISSDLALGQFALVSVAATMFSAWALARGGALAGGAGALVAALQPALCLPLVAFARSWRALHALAAAATIFALGWIVLAAFSPAAAPLRYVALLRAHDAAERFALIQYAPSAIAYGFGAGGGTASAIGLACAIAAIAGWCVLTARARLSSPASFLLACALVPFAVPFFHEHDFALLFVPALYAATRTRSSLGRALAIGGALLCAIDWLGIAQRPDGAAQSLLLACGFLAALVAAGVRLDRTAVAAAGCVGVALMVAIAAAHGDPAPVWPDAMHWPLAFSPAASAAAIWHAEQAAARMFDVDAFHAALRLAPLTGALAVGWATVLAKVPSDSRNP